MKFAVLFLILGIFLTGILGFLLIRHDSHQFCFVTRDRNCADGVLISLLSHLAALKALALAVFAEMLLRAAALFALGAAATSLIFRPARLRRGIPDLAGLVHKASLRSWLSRLEHSPTAA